MAEQVYLNGKLVDAVQAQVSAGNPAFLHGVGLFETLRAYDGRAFALGRHVERMRTSAGQLDMPLGDVLERVPEAVRQVLAVNGLKNARIRFTATPPGAGESAAEPTLLVAAQETAGYPPELYEKGMTVCICDRYRQSSQDPLAGHKTTSYYSRLMALRMAQAKQCGEALWATPANHLAEGSISNLFLVKGGRLRTPPVDTPVLPGITRGIVLELAGESGLTADEAPCTIDDLLDADEVFLTNAIMEVMPVARIERRAIANEQPGAVTRRLHELYRQRVTRGE